MQNDFCLEMFATSKDRPYHISGNRTRPALLAVRKADTTLRFHLHVTSNISDTARCVRAYCRSAKLSGCDKLNDYCCSDKKQTKTTTTYHFFDKKTETYHIRGTPTPPVTAIRRREGPSHRLTQGRKMFNTLRPMLSCPQILENKRLRTAAGFQGDRWRRWILSGRKKGDLDWVQWRRETKRAAHTLRCKLATPAVWHKALAAVRGCGLDILLGRQDSIRWCTGAAVNGGR